MWNGPDLRSHPVLLVNAYMRANTLTLRLLLGSCLIREPAGLIDLRPTAMGWIYLAQAWLSAPFHKSRLSYTALQLHCLILLARQTNYVGPELVWISAGTLVRMATHMGLHRDPTNYPKMSSFHVELRRRLWAVTLEMALQSSLDSGMPPLISQDDYDTLAPKNIDDSEIAENRSVSRGILRSMRVLSHGLHIDVYLLLEHFQYLHG